MRLPAALVGAVLVALSASNATAVVRITDDVGGRIGTYVEAYSAVRSSGERVVIDGACLSACTLVLGIVPRERICVTRRARLGFHAAWHPGDNGRPVTSRGGTQLLMDVYPPHVKNWIRRRGGLTPQMKYLSGRELASMYRTCR